MTEFSTNYTPEKYIACDKKYIACQQVSICSPLTVSPPRPADAARGPFTFPTHTRGPNHTHFASPASPLLPHSLVFIAFTYIHLYTGTFSPRSPSWIAMLKLMSFSTRRPAVRGFCTFMRALTSAEQRFVNQAFLALDDNGDGVLQMEEGQYRIAQLI